MRNSLLSIGEAAKLKNVSIRALRYYEKIGVFNPAYVDPQSGYRYYSPAQLFDLDVILTCTELGIPLKRILDYRTNQGSLDLHKLLIEGAEIAEQNIQRSRQSLLQINSWLKECEHQTHFHNYPDFHTRTLQFSYYCSEAWDITRPFDIMLYLKTMSNLYQMVNDLDATPLYFQGLIIDTIQTPALCQAYVALDLYPNTLNIDLQHSETTITPTTIQEISYLPENTYTGFRIERNTLTDCITSALSYAEEHPGFFVMTEVWDEKLTTNTYVVELLQLNNH